MSFKPIFSASWKLAAVLFCIVNTASALTFENFTYTVIGGGVTIIDYPDEAIGAVVIPAVIEGKTVVAIADDAFDYCSTVASVQIPFGVTSIGGFAFNGCTGMTSVSIPGSVTSIGTQAFLNCTSLAGVIIPASVTSIGDRAFEYCTAMTAITVDALNPAYSSSSGILFDKSKSVLIECPAGKAGSVSIPGTVTRIAGYAFADCAGLTSVTIPNSVTRIEELAFYVCSSLTGITIPHGVTHIGGSAFYECKKLTSVTIPSSVTQLGTWAFQSCALLASATFIGNAPVMGTEVFELTAAGFKIYYYADRAGFTSPNWLGYPAIALAALPVFDSWLVLNGLPAGSNPQSDSNGDGVSLLMAYALDLNPNQNLAGSMPAPVISGNQMKLTYYAVRPGVTYKVQSSSDLQNWSTTNVTLSALSGNFRTASINLAGPDRFMRLVVSY